MKRVTRLGFLVLSILGATAYAGCGTATTLEELDSGAPRPDTGGAAADTGITILNDGSILQDTGVTNPFDSGMVMPPIDGGGFMRPDGAFMRPDSGMPMMGNDSGTTTGVMCGTAVCGSGEICCVTRGAGGMMISQACTAPGMCSMGAMLACDGPEDCTAGQACCGSIIGTTAGAMCVDSAMCSRGRLCHATSDCTGADMCCSFMGLNVCSPRCF